MMATDFADEAGRQIPVNFEQSSVISTLARPFHRVREMVKG